jgi:hypothetical protein
MIELEAITFQIEGVLRLYGHQSELKEPPAWQKRMTDSKKKRYYIKNI